MKELVIASNMIALARNRKGDSKRSAMLRMIMPFLSRETGDKLAQAISEHSSKKFALMWDKVKHEIQHRLEKSHGHVTTASARDEQGYADVTTFERDDSTSICIQTYGPKKIRISMNGVTVMEGIPEAGTFVPANPLPMRQDECPDETPCVVSEPTATIQINNGSTGENFIVTGDHVVKIVKLVCERLLMDADPCPLAPIENIQTPINVENRCTKHDWIDCRACLMGLDDSFDFSANILELYDRLSTSKSV